MKKKSLAKLPEKMIMNISKILTEDEMQKFLESFEEEPVAGLRVNTLKISVEDFLRISPFELTPVPWTENGFYYNKEDRPGKHPYYYAGLYYLQEPSAMLPALVLFPDENSKVLDICAAPGGKSTQLAELMNNKGLLVVNDISPKRAMALISNLVRLGVTNAVVCNSKPENLVKVFSDYFTHILIDAPCSGEGMFRRDPGAIENLSIYSPEECQILQRDILTASMKMIKDQGKIAYSTCTFNELENEENMKWFSGFEGAEMISMRRIWPHKEKGEGQFVGLVSVQKEEKTSNKDHAQKKIIDEEFSGFIKDTIKEEYLGIFNKELLYEKGSKMYLLPLKEKDLTKINVLKPGWFLGENKKNRFEPSADLALGLPLDAFRRVLDLSSESAEVISYLKGETLVIDYPEKGWSIMAVDGYPLGWFKKDGPILKNYYPKSMRRMD